MDPITQFQTTTAVSTSRYMSRVYGWMTFGLLITAVTSFVIGHDPYLLQMLLGNTMGLVLSALVPLGIVLFLSAGINRISVGTATLLFLLYSFSNAVLLSTIFLRYSPTSIGNVFFITAGSFAALAAFGMSTKRDLTAMGAFLGMVLFGLIIAMVVNMFLHSPGFDFALSVIAVFLFAGLTAYDSQKIKNMARMGDIESDTAHKMAIVGALVLYLDFINLFLSLLRILGDRRR